MKVALINSSNIVENIVMWDEASVPPDGLRCISLSDDTILSIGFLYQADGSFIDPEPIPLAPETSQQDLTDLQTQLMALQAQIEALASAQKTTKPI